MLQPTVDELARRGTPFVGLLYAGLALTGRGVRVIEFNARFGDPETQPLLARLITPLGGLLYAAATGSLADQPELEWTDDAAVGVVLAAENYPGTPVTGGVIDRPGARRRDRRPWWCTPVPPSTPRAGWSAAAAGCSAWSGTGRRSRAGPGARVRRDRPDRRCPARSTAPTSRAQQATPARRTGAHGRQPRTRMIGNVLANRYASAAMRDIWSAESKIIAERRLWLAVLTAQNDLGVDLGGDDPAAVLAAYEAVVDSVDLASIAARERVTRHDVKARIEEFNALAGYEHVHKGMTSRDLTENVEQLQIVSALDAGPDPDGHGAGPARRAGRPLRRPADHRRGRTTSPPR